MTSIDPLHFRRTLGHYPTGVVAVTAIQTDGTPTGMAVGSFTSVSLDPPLVAFFPAKSSSTYPRIEEAGRFCVNVLSAEQESVSRTFASKDADRFSTLSWRPAPETGAPILDGAVAWIDCEITSVEEAGDHFIVLGKVLALDVGGPELPLIFFQGGYGRFSMRSLVAPSEAGLFDQLRAAELARGEMERIAAEVEIECMAVGSTGDEIVFVAGAGAPVRGEVPTRVGMRIPFVPPIGGLFVAWAGARERETWLARAGAAEGDARAAAERVLELIRQRGWSLALRHPDADEFERGVGAFSRGQTPDLERDFKQRIASLVDLYEPDPIDGDAMYEIWAVAAPVFDRHGDVVLNLILLAADGATTSFRGSEIVALAERLCAAAGRVTERIGGRHP